MTLGTSHGEPHTKVIQDVWKNTISTIPSDIGKLAYLASLRDPNSGRYHHFGLESLYSSEQADTALRQTHLELFYDWLKNPLAGQKDDLEHYFRTVEGDLGIVLENWAVLQPYRNFIPLDSDGAGRQLFLDDIALIVELMEYELFPSRPSIASPPP